MTTTAYHIVPQEGIAGLSLGTPKTEVRTFFGSAFRTFRKTPTDPESDYWPAVGVFAYYTIEDQLEALEFASPANVQLDGTPLLQIAVAHLSELLGRQDPYIKLEPDGFRSPALGIAAWQATPERDQPAEAIMLFGRGYFSDL